MTDTNELSDDVQYPLTMNFVKLTPAVFLSMTLASFSSGQGAVSFEQGDRARQAYSGIPNAEYYSTLTSQPFSWFNPFPENFELLPNLYHESFISPSMQRKVGYVIFLPSQYFADDYRSFPVVYYLHGGRPGNETKSTYLANFLHESMSSGKAQPIIYVFVNGGEISHWNYPPLASMGEDVFVKELIPHIDLNYRTVDNRSGRAIQGFSQGGRGATRIAFKYPDLFSSVAAGGGAYQVEMQIAENGGVEYDTRSDNPERLDFGLGNDAYSLAKSYVNSGGHRLSVAFWGGTKGFNYNDILEYMGYLDSLNVNYQSYFVDDVGHNSWLLYHSIGIDLLNFRVNAFEKFTEDF